MMDSAPITVADDTRDHEPITKEWLDLIVCGSPFLDLNGWHSWKIRVPKTGELTIARRGNCWAVGVSAASGFVPQYTVETRGHVRKFVNILSIARGNDPGGDRVDFRREVAELFACVADRFETVEKVWEVLFEGAGKPPPD